MSSTRFRLLLAVIQAGTLILAMMFLLDRGALTAMAQDADSQTVLQFAGPDEVPVGNRARLLVILEDSRGMPIADAIILFTTPSLFAGTVAEMEIGTIVTDTDGLATLDYQLRVQGRNQFIARFHGDAEHQPAESRTEVIATGTAQLAERTAGVSVPFFGSWTLIVVIGAVWTVYLLVMRLVSQIPEDDLQIGGEAE